MPEKKKNTKKSTPCESCVHYDVIDEDGTYGCTVDIDEDEAYAERANAKSECAYYRFYDEYKSVQRQN